MEASNSVTWRVFTQDVICDVLLLQKLRTVNRNALDLVSAVFSSRLLLSPHEGAKGQFLTGIHSHILQCAHDLLSSVKRCDFTSDNMWNFQFSLGEHEIFNKVCKQHKRFIILVFTIVYLCVFICFLIYIRIICGPFLLWWCSRSV